MSSPTDRPRPSAASWNPGRILDLLHRLEGTDQDAGVAAATEPAASGSTSRSTSPATMPETGAGSLEQSAEDLWQALDALDDIETEGVLAPDRSARLHQRFYAELGTGAVASERQTSPPETGRADGRSFLDRWLTVLWPRSGPAQALLVAATLVLGLALGVTWQRERELSQLRADVGSIGRTVALALLEHSSASERLRGVALSSEALSETPDRTQDREIVHGLIDVLSYDESENVRLAAVEALSRIADRPDVRSGLANALSRQDSPLLQVSLADVLARSGNGQGERALRKLAAQKDLDPTVRQRVEELLSRPKGKESA